MEGLDCGIFGLIGLGCIFDLNVLRNVYSAQETF